jgi:phosphatidylinositol-3-phosphatase
MRSVRALWSAFALALVAALAGTTPAHAAPRPAATTAVPAFDHIFTILMENHSYNEIIGNTSQAPYINQLVSQYGVAANYVAVTHPSLPNYLALTGGDTFGITSDCTTCFVNAPNIAVDRVEASGRTWKAYQESMPSPCFIGDASPYVQKHNPFIYYNDIRLNSTECNKDVPYTQLATDLASAATTPNYVFITPNLINDMHDGTINQGDTWLRQNVPTILNSPAFTTQNSVLNIVWDEDDSSQGNHVPSVIINSAVTPGYHSFNNYTHYSWLKTIESAWGLAALTTNDGNATAMADFFTPQTGQTLPGAPTNATATAGRRSATVAWTPPANNGGCPITTYTATSSPGSVSATASGTATSVSVTGLTPGTSYTFTVTATNCVGTGPASAPSNPVVPRKH